MTDATQTIQHTSVLLAEAVAALNPQPGRLYIDATLGGGGHSALLCQHLDASNTLIGLDQDPVALEVADKRLAGCMPTLKLVQGNFGDLTQVLWNLGLLHVDGGILLDLGYSAYQMMNPERGFSFMHPAPLDMRMDPANPVTAEALVNTLSPSELADIFYQYADERFSRQIASAIVKARPVTTTDQLARIAEGIYRAKGAKAQNIHPATRVFQALRMAVNQETAMLEALLEQLPKVLTPGARVAIITFHSIEDRLVKQYFRLASAACLCPPHQPVCTCKHQAAFKVIGKPITASAEELERNPQARSAKLRVAERV